MRHDLPTQLISGPNFQLILATAPNSSSTTAPPTQWLEPSGGGTGHTII